MGREFFVGILTGEKCIGPVADVTEAGQIRGSGVRFFEIGRK
jgi:hypothetical protein